MLAIQDDGKIFVEYIIHFYSYQKTVLQMAILWNVL